MISPAKIKWLAGQVTPIELAARLRLRLRKALSREWRGDVPSELATRTVFKETDHRERLVRAFEENGLTGETIRQASRVMDGVFTLFGGITHDVGDELPDWLAAWPQGHRWEENYFFDIDISGSDGRDVRYTWELSRHGDLVALARAAFLSNDNSFRIRMETLLSDWIEKNPFLKGPNWASALEVGVRAVAWVFIDDASPIRDALERGRFLEVLYQHGAYLELFMTSGFNPSNHIIGEAAGLFLLGCKFTGEAPARWRAMARRILEEELRRQTYPSGASREHSINYHRFVTALFSVALCVSGKDAFSRDYRSRLGGMYRFLAEVARPDGSFADLGDSDNADALPMAPPAPNDLSGDLALGAALFPGEAPLPAGVAVVSPQVLWLLGPRKAINTQAAPVKSSLVEGAGLFVLKSPGGRLQAEFDAGPQGFSPVASHGHADALALTLWRGGERLVDAGTYRYNGDPAWRDAFRSTAFHNTVTVDGRSQASPARSFRWLTLADAKPSGSFLSEDFDWARGTLEPDANRPWRHEREVIRVGDSVIIVLDHVKYRGRHECRTRFHTGEAALSVCGNSTAATYVDGASMKILGPEGAAISVETIWRSKLYGEKRESSALQAVAEFENEAFLPWVIAFDEAKLTRIAPDKGAMDVVRAVCGNREFVWMAGREPGLAHVGGVRLVGRWCLLEIARGIIKKAWAADAWALEEDSRRLFTCFGGASTGIIYEAEAD